LSFPARKHMKNQLRLYAPTRGLVSIVIPCYNGATFLPEAIESCLRQTYRELEVIVVDDGSPDSCAEIADRYALTESRVRVVRRTRNGGVSRAFNSGFRHARGEYFTRLAQDDVFRHDAVALMKDRLDADRNVGLVYCDVQLIDDQGKWLRVLPMKEPPEALAKGNGVGVCAMWRGSVWETVGGFDPTFDAAEDYEYWLRVAKHFIIDKVPAAAPLYFRLHGEMGSRRLRNKQEVAHGFAQARHCGNWRKARWLKSQALFEAGYNYREQGAFGTAARHLFAAIGWWPFTLRNYRCLCGLTVTAFSTCLRRNSERVKLSRASNPSDYNGRS
jgi:glycosyltransferase involved in cell wall biosynthesis